MGLLRITAAPEPDRCKQLRKSVPFSSDRDALRHDEVITRTVDEPTIQYCRHHDREGSN